ncbi:hypothetical protein DL767_002565 [Monosporascus sp. MG133]|nr:hypothetical protein DL767_002565 [Monosporascus sp. MG133]
MDQDSRSSESRERALSSEPSSTRPNPFYDDQNDLSSRKRRRTSHSLSRSRSVDTVRSRDDIGPSPSISDSNMNIDTPDPESEPVLPSTPAKPERPAEPVSSRVTLTLRNPDSLKATPASPDSPIPAKFRSDNVKAGVEEKAANMTREVAQPAGPQVSGPASPEVPVVSIEDDDEETELTKEDPERMQFDDMEAARLLAHLADFPYRGATEAAHDTLRRLIHFFQHESVEFLDVVRSLHAWIDKISKYAHAEFYPVVMEAYSENRQFWQMLPELFVHIVKGQVHDSQDGLIDPPNFRSRIRPGRARGSGDILRQLYHATAKLAGFMVAVDCRTLSSVVAPEQQSDLELLSPGFISFLVTVTWDDNLSGGCTLDVHEDALRLFDAFQPGPGGVLADVNRLLELQTSLLDRSPKKVIDLLQRSSKLAYNVMLHTCQMPSYPASVPLGIAARLRKNLECGLRFFNIASTILGVVVDKSSNNLSPDQTPHLLHSLSVVLTTILRSGAEGDHAEAKVLLQDHRRAHPEISPVFTAEAIPHEWRLAILNKLMRSQQIQLRVAAASYMCNDLVNLWKRYSDGLERGESDSDSRLGFLRYFSSYLVSIGIIDYILGPTCHPEITAESANIIGFLVVTQTYITAHTDLWWQTVTSTQDPRISDALVRMIVKVLHLFPDPEPICYMCEKLDSLPIDAFNASMREFCDKILVTWQTKFSVHQPMFPTILYKLFVRLLQESSAYGPQCSIAFPDIQPYAVSKLKDILHYGTNPSAREEMFLNCVQDIANKSRTTSGSFQALCLLMGPTLQLPLLVTRHDFARLLIEDLVSTTTAANAMGFSPVYAHPVNAARRRYISRLIVDYGSTIDSELGQRLWDLLVGTCVTCQDDRRVGWEDLIAVLQKTRMDNPFLQTCMREYLPKLPSSCYCAGSLEFVREAIVPLANEPNGLILDDEDSLRSAGLELLWQMILTAPPRTIEDRAIATLVNEIYVDSKSILSFPLHRAREVHFSLVRRCMQQLRSSAEKLKTFSDGTVSGDDEPMVIVATDEQQRQQELRFTRSLQVLKTLLRTVQSRSHFAAPDLRSLMLQNPSSVEGKPADLKYQSFSGDEQSPVKPLSIGLRNTVACLLTSIREATGFDNYRLYYRGQPLTPSETEICKTLEDLGICNGLILVKKELGGASSPVRIKPGASPLDIEILSHFGDLWDYLSMEEALAGEIYQFLVKLPADESILAVFDDPTKTYRDVFPSGQPFKCLYALHALREYLSTRRLKNSVSRVSAQNSEKQRESATADQEDALVKAMSLIIVAICDPDLINRCSSEVMRMALSFQLVDNYVQLLKGIPSIAQLLNTGLQQRLLEILIGTVTAHPSPSSLELIHRSFEAMLESCAKSDEFWTSFKSNAEVSNVTKSLLLAHPSPLVRRSILKLISSKTFYNHGPSGVRAVDFAEMFWPTVWELLPQAVAEPSKSEEVLSLCLQLLRKLVEADSPRVDLPACLIECGELLMSHTSTEDIAHPENVDVVAHGLIAILFHGIRHTCAQGKRMRFPSNFPRKLLSRHLFPPEEENGPLIPAAVLHPPSRNMLYEIIFVLVKSDSTQLTGLLHDLKALTPYRVAEDEEPYIYELPQFFDRSKAIRSPCGYPGLRNLSNTCYLNSLFTQLFMNVSFRRFMLNVPVSNPEAYHLLGETQSLFAALQDSRRRFVDPQLCVSQIVTYDESPIDIHNQMDVDEFYNLLFDRWESQMSSDRAKRKLRSYYGGHLVQQVKSKECEHISERIEPFSAIQCDIKGKTNLEESLQAYVDGEIMEGDAVKRACLKDLPDNLIFHLKRFDFNLKTMQRSKINDYFAFPSKIDMQPYTIEHLSGAASSEPDMFELVGVLVHSGTAETGHYYSFIRERPNLNDRESWVEFNDDLVGPWDPSMMEGACFGGTEFRSQFDGSGTYERVYSAYMLFYQRSSALDREKGLLRESGQSGPLRCDLPPALEAQVKAENWGIVQRHCLHDQSHIPFVHRVLSHVWGTECPQDHKIQNLAMFVGLGHLDQVASRAKELPDHDLLRSLLNLTCQRCHRCCAAFFEYFSFRPEALRNLLQKNPEASVRQETAHMLIHALTSIKTHFPDDYGVGKDAETRRLAAPEETVIMQAVELFLKLWETFHNSLRAWPEYFGTLTAFAQLGQPEAAALLECDFLAKALMIISADPSFELPFQYAKMITVMARRVATRPPNYENIINLIDALLDVMDPQLEQGLFVEQPGGRFALASDGTIPFAVHEVNLLHKEWSRNHTGIFLDKLIQINQNPLKTDSIVRRLMGLSPIMDRMVFRTLKWGITGALVAFLISPSLRVAATYCHNSTDASLVHHLIHHITSQCRGVQNPEGRSFFEFYKETFEGTRKTGESSESIHIQSLQNLSEWAPGLLGYIDRTVSYDVEVFLQEKLFKYGPSPDFGESDGGLARSRAMDQAARKLAVSCLMYLKDTYVSPSAQAARDSVLPLERVIKACEVYFSLPHDAEEFPENEYQELRDILERMSRLVVDEIEEDGSEWENSPGSSEQMDSLADLSMQVERELYDEH